MIPKSLSKQFDTVIVLDTETTGIKHKEDRIIELAAARMDKKGGKKPSATMDLFIRLPLGQTIPDEIVLLTGITDQMLEEEGVEEEEAARRFASLFPEEGRILVCAYNAQFDLCFLYYCLLRHGYTDLLKRSKFLDLLTVYKDRRPYPHKLCNAVESYRLHTENTHRAIDDTLAAFELLSEMGKEKDDLFAYINLFGYNPKYGVSGPKIASITYRPQRYDPKNPLYEEKDTPIV